MIGAKLSEALGQPILYDNRPGAGGRIGFELLAQTPPNGYTIASGSVYESNSWKGIVTRAGVHRESIAALDQQPARRRP